MPNELSDGKINNELVQILYVAAGNQLVCQMERCLCETLNGYQRGEKIVRGLANKRVVGKMNVYIAKVGRRVDYITGLRSPHLRIENGSRGRAQSREIV